MRLVIDALRGPVQYRHDGVGNLAAAVYEDGRVDLRMPDAVGNLFRTEARTDRKYGPAGQLLESHEPDGRVVTYGYDPEGNLVRKVETAAGGAPQRVWTYAWNGAGMLAKVIRPDGDEVTFTYDALGRRLSKTFRGKTTKWIWDGNVPLHEWTESSGDAATEAPLIDDAALDEVTARRRRAEQAAHAPHAPPPEEGTPTSPITWLFEPESFAPMAKLVGGSKYAIITDHLGTPRAMYDAAGAQAWSASIDAYGTLRHVEGPRSACPFRWPGQYEDEETGLYYNRFRYYDAAAGAYVSQDPIRMSGGNAFYAYPSDPLTWLDPMGLAACGTAAGKLPQMKGMSVGEAEALLADRGFTRTNPANPKNQRWVHPDGSEVQVHAYGNANTGPYESGNNAHIHKDVGRHGQPGTVALTDRGIPSTDPSATHIGMSNPSDFPSVSGRPHGT